MSGFSNDILSGKTILVAGAGKGIGFTCAKMAADLGAHVIAVARTESDLNHLKSASSGSIETWQMDVTSEEFLTRLSQLPTLDGLINNAGTNRVGLMQEQTNDNIDAVINLNIKTLYNTN